MENNVGKMSEYRVRMTEGRKHRYGMEASRKAVPAQFFGATGQAKAQRRDVWMLGLKS
jgi:hypothetical protein